MWETIEIKESVKKNVGESKKSEGPPLSEKHGSDVLTSGKHETRVAELIV